LLSIFDKTNLVRMSALIEKISVSLLIGLLTCFFTVAAFYSVLFCFYKLRIDYFGWNYSNIIEILMLAETCYFVLELTIMTVVLYIILRANKNRTEREGRRSEGEKK
jgi:hypothetical protein